MFGKLAKSIIALVAVVIVAIAIPAAIGAITSASGDTRSTVRRTSPNGERCRSQVERQPPHCFAK